jgi:hypothetical protein
MSGDQRDIGVAIKKYVGEFAADLAGRSGNCNLHRICLLIVVDVQGCLATQKQASDLFYIQSRLLANGTTVRRRRSPEALENRETRGTRISNALPSEVCSKAAVTTIQN